MVSLFSFTRFNPERLIFLSLWRLNESTGFCKNTTIWQNILPVPTRGSHTNQESLVRESEGSPLKTEKNGSNPCNERKENVFMKCDIREFWRWQSETFSRQVPVNTVCCKECNSCKRGGLPRDVGTGK